VSSLPLVMSTGQTGEREMAKVGELQIGSAAEYDRDGFVIEQFVYGNCPEPHWCVPGWVEDQWGESGFFATEAEARDFLEMVTA
jgi:hypothetical protein